MTTVAPFKNQHLSYSRLSRFETCPLSYRLHYIEKKQAEPGLPLRFGKTIHAVLERLIKEVVDDERTGPLSEERAVELYREAWGAERLTGPSYRARPGRSPRVLVVDDEPSIANAVRRELSTPPLGRYRYAVETFNDPVAALARAVDEHCGRVSQRLAQR